MRASKQLTKREIGVLRQVLKTMREPLPTNGTPHVIVITYNARYWAVNKAAPKGHDGLTIGS